ncbi:methanethiol S-methyltransferase [Methylobacterium brachythecii]|uniref:methanethiol S-methyltransferase n=1 Tax=Methylobacterium brachythecii TaxID=1176177 RepID=A0A7W6F9S4_9HYPH|nr:methanethiol S-methyltransferase [Methylobacterium brachythecii]MBB3905451.1 protein-S-isoprenylcysteine O-methyltransferase Ste14 [Methylobacterium brachythecii]GLS44932.1 membrane protein [Methylobacterium brachythecii]
MTRVAAMMYGLFAYLIFSVTFLYAVGFTGGILVPKGIDDGLPDLPWPAAMVANLGLLSLFAVQHSVMARPGFKTWWTKYVPQPIERSTYVLLASAALLLLFWQWQPLTASVWSIEKPLMAGAIKAAFWLGWLIVVTSTFMISHFDLFGLKQTFARRTVNASGEAVFKAPMLYRYVRHPIYVGFVIAFWSSPAMSVGHFLFAAVTTVYILVGIQLEERDLLTVFGDRYRRYRDEVGMLVPRFRPASNRTSAKSNASLGSLDA